MARTAQIWGLILAGIVSSALCFGGRIYVDFDAPGNEDGSSWINAYNQMQSALAVAGAGDEICAAGGTYKPDYDVGSGTYTGERTATFQLVNGVAIKGGYAGYGEADPNLRDIEAYETILTGDLNGDDDSNFANYGENSYHVVTGSGTDSNAILDGVTITGGYADGVAPEDCGGGMYNFGGSPTVQECSFIANYSMTMGGGMFNREDSSPVINECRFIGNKSDDDGGGIRNYLNCHPVISNCSFIGNVAFEDGGGINNRKNSNAIITNCVFIGNTAYAGGGMENHVGRATATGEATISNCLFVGNSASEGGGMRNNDPSPIVTNCIFRGNSGGSLDGSSTPMVTFSNVEGGFAGEGNINADPLFADAAGGDYHLRSRAGRWDVNSPCWVVDAATSPCVDAGDPNSEWTEELWPHGRQINMGAYGGTRQASMSESDLGNIADLDNDDEVDLVDFTMFTGRWLSTECLLAEDLDRDGVVDFRDFGVFANNQIE
jgi:hypothetical protein